MKTKGNQLKYIEWLNAEDMHDNSRKWLSELEFIKDEELFFDDLIKLYTLQLTNSKHFTESKKIVDKLSKFHKKTDNLISMVKIHERKLKIMADGIDQLKEGDNYKDEHQWFTKNLNQFLEKYRAFKVQLFNLLKGILKEQKQKLLLK
jgi:hypothetical protein